MPSSLGVLRLVTFTSIIALVLQTIIFNFISDIDYCARERVYDKSWHRHIYLIASTTFAAACFILIVMWRPFKLTVGLTPVQQYFRSCFYAMYIVLWYTATYCVCVFGKEILNDKMCNSEKHNSVSGHFLFHTFFAVSIPFLFFSIGRLSYKDSLLHQLQQQQQPQPNQTSHQLEAQRQRNEFVYIKSLFTSSKLVPLIVVCYIAYLVTSVINMQMTWSHGYHSPRQISYGSILSLLSLSILLATTTQVSRRSLGVLTLMAAMTAHWMLSIALIYWSGFRFPLSRTGIIVGIIFYIFMAYLALSHLVKLTASSGIMLPQPSHRSRVDQAKRRRKHKKE
ncbi:hypothetical protein SAMD00019534_105200, partial [Acytostelium subglobosum LB1]|uniref:hypothetical protein n=1 Tax=Acytostelium subglobosum LB1 TaxID=1410327 RepID=UPI000644A3B4